MSNLYSSVRTLTAWILLGAVAGVLPAAAASQQPGTLAGGAAPALSLPLYEAARIAPLPQASSGASPAPAAKHHISKWVWVAIAAGVGIGAGVGVMAGNSQSGKTAAVPPSATIGVGTGPSAGAP